MLNFNSVQVCSKCNKQCELAKVLHNGHEVLKQLLHMPVPISVAGRQYDTLSECSSISIILNQGVC